MRRHAFIAGLIACLCLPAGAARAADDTRVEFRMTEGSFGLTSILIAGPWMRVDSTGESLLVETTSGTVVMLNHQRKSFTRITTGDRDAFFGGLAGVMAEFRKAVEALTPEERTALLSRQPELASLIDGGGATMEAAGDATVAGRPCSLQRWTVNTRALSETCVASPATLTMPDADAATFKAALAVISTFMKGLEQVLPRTLSGTSTLSETSFPLRQTAMAQGVRHTSEFVGLSHDALPTDAFSIPSGYQEVKPGG